MLLTSENLTQIRYKTKRVKLEKADAEINIALLPGSLVQEAKELREDNLNEDSTDAKSFGLKALMAAVVDDKGEPVFTTEESFESLPPAIQAEIMNAVWEYNGLSESSIKALEKNSVSSPSEDSISD